jgi:hypothetical protein
LMSRQFNLPITAITGPATDNEVGLDYIQSSLGLPAHNARRDAAGLLGVVVTGLEDWSKGHESRVTSHDSSGSRSVATRDSRLATLHSA